MLLRRLRTYSLGLVTLGVIATLGLAATANGFEAPAAWSVSRQMVVVTTDGWDVDHGSLRTYERDGTTWKQVGTPADVTIGKHGSAWGVGLHPVQQDGPTKVEGDARSPAGIFRIGQAFGYAETNGTALPYRGLTASDYCVDVTDSPYYNQVVDTRQVGEKAVAGAPTASASSSSTTLKADAAQAAAFSRTCGARRRHPPPAARP